MDESPAMRALLVGVSLFVAIIVVGSIVLYYNSATQAIRVAGEGTDFDAIYRQDIKDLLLYAGTNNQITGTNVKNILNYYYDKMNTEIIVEGMKYVSDDGSIKENTTLTLSSSDEFARTTNYNIIMKNIINNQHFTLQINEDTEDSLKITIKGE